MGRTKQVKDEEIILDGKFLTKSDLIDRLILMGVNIEEKNKEKSYYSELYNVLIMQKDQRKKIKSLTDTDLIDRPEKNLNRKRHRGDSNDTPQFKDSAAKSGRSSAYQSNVKSRDTPTPKRSNLKSSERRSTAKKNQNISFQDIKAQNMSLPTLMQKIENDYNQYRTNFQKIEIKKTDSVVATNNNYNLSFSKEFNLGNEATASKLDKLESQRKLDYESSDVKEINVIELSQPTPLINNEPMEVCMANNENQNFLDSSQNINVISDTPMRKSPSNNVMTTERYFPSSNSQADLIINESSQVRKTPEENQGETGRRSLIISTSPINQTERRQVNSFRESDNYTRQKSLPGSSKNIQEILNRVEIRANPVSPRIPSSNNQFYFRAPSVRVSESKLNFIPSARLSISSAKNIIVTVRAAPECSEFEKENVKEKAFSCLSLCNVTNAVKNVDLKVFFTGTIAFVSVIALGYYLLMQVQDHNLREQIRNTISGMDNNLKYLLITVILSVVGLYLYKRFSDVKYFRNLAQEDYEKIKQIIENNYRSEESPLGVFENTIMKSLATSHNMTEENYRKLVLPLLEKIRIEKNEFEEKEVLIQEQSQKVWDYRIIPSEDI